MKAPRQAALGDFPVEVENHVEAGDADQPGYQATDVGAEPSRLRVRERAGIDDDSHEPSLRRLSG